MLCIAINLNLIRKVFLERLILNLRSKAKKCKNLGKNHNIKLNSCPVHNLLNTMRLFS
jgi:hypothetical protein